MIERMDDAPDGVIGLRASGEVTADDYRRVLEPALAAGADAGEIRFLYVLDDDFSMSAGAVAQDAKVGIALGAGHHSAWTRTAIVTDSGRLSGAIHAFGWMLPGDVRVFGLAQMDAARDWVAG